LRKHKFKSKRIKDLRDLNKKSFSPIISVILLLVIAVIIVGSILSWGLITTSNSLDKSQEIYKEDPTLTGYIYTSNPQPESYIVKNLSDKDVIITKYEIVAPQDSEILNKPITLDDPVNLNSGSMVSVPIICNPDESFKVNLITSDGKYITVPINNSNYQSNSCFNNTEVPDAVCLGITENGSGDTEEDPFVICSIDDLNSVRNRLDKHYKLGKNLDLNVNPYNEGEGFEPIGNNSNIFTGSLDGDGRTITNLYINRPTTDYIGLFGNSNGSVFNLHLEDINIIGQNYTAGLVGKNFGTITSCSVNGRIIGQDYIGGLTGQNGSSALIEFSYSQIDILGNNYVGGLVGYNFRSNIYNSYSIGTISGIDYVGGLVGRNSGDTMIPSKIFTSYTSVNVIPLGTIVGGFVGGHGGSSLNPPICMYSSNYWDQNIISLDLNSIGDKGELEGITKSTTTEMKDSNNFTGWDFTDIWAIQEGIAYPYLRNNTQDPLPE
jgi:hypothetical protein